MERNQGADESEVEALRRLLAERDQQLEVERRDRRERDRQLAERDQQLEVERRDRRERDRQLAEQDRLLAEQKQLNEGTFYATFDEVWDARPVPYNDYHYQAMIRREYPSCGIGELTSRFEKTVKLAEDPSVEAATKGTRLSLSTLKKLEIWPVDVWRSIFRHRNNKFIQIRQRPGQNPNTSNESTSLDAAKSMESSEIAHLLPHAPTLSVLYHHVAIWVFGIKPRNQKNADYVRKLIEGSEERVGNGEPSRISKTGLKYMYCNMVRLFCQAPFFDKKPHLIIVPVLTLQQAKNWKGEGYHALFMISTGNYQTNNDDGILGRVAKGVQMLDIGEFANDDEINAARKLLAATVLGLADALVKKSDDSAGWVRALHSEISKNKLTELRGAFTVITGDVKVKIPIMRAGNIKKVRKVTFAPAFGSEEGDGHPAPDPLLLAVKAGVNWSWFHNQKLMAAGERDDSDSDMSERFVSAMDEYLAAKRHYERASRDDEIMNMTINVS